MTFRPILPYSGSDGWGYLRETLDQQKARFADSVPTATRIDLEAFRNRIAGADTATRLLDDPVLLRVALKAFGLGDARPSRGFLQQVLNTATTGPDAAGRFADARWFEMARAFGYGDGVPRVGDAGFADDIEARHRIQGFEAAVGASSPDMRRALAADRTMASLAAGGFEAAEGWRQAVADPTLRHVLRGALGLGTAFDMAAPEKQAAMAGEAAGRLLGIARVDDLDTAAARDAVLGRFLDAARGAGIAGLGFVRPQTGQGGVAGWRVLQGSLDGQRAGFERLTRNDPELRHFAGRVAGAATAAAFVQDQRMVDVALTAFGLGDRRPTADFLQQVMESDTADPGSFANRQSDPRWRDLAAAFGYGDGQGARVAEFGFAEDILARWRIHGFEEAVGRQDTDMRRALILDRTLTTLAGAGLGAREGWERALANPSIALALGRAFDLGDDFSTQPPAGQVDAVMAAARSLTGSDRIDAFARDLSRDVVVRRFLSAPEAPARARGLGQPVVPLPGVAGWSFLKRTLDDQRESFAASAQVQREMAHFRENIARIESADDLVADRRLLAVALEAFGMGDEIDKRAYIAKALREGSEDPGALAVRMVDSRYREMAAAFGFGDGRGPQTGVDGFAEGILARFKVRAFETAVGNVDESMRLALNFDRTMAENAASGRSDKALWLRIVGDVPLRRVFEAAFNLPGEFAKLDIDRQVSVLQERARRTLGSGSVSGFADPAKREDVIRRFLIRDSLGDGLGAGTPGLGALQMLQAMPRPGLNRLL